LNYAQELFNQGKYEESAVEFGMVAYLHPSNPVNANALIGMANSYMRMNLYEDAFFAIDQILLNNLSDSIVLTSTVIGMQSSYLQKNYLDALLYINRIEKNLDKKLPSFGEFLFTKALVYAALNKFDSAKVSAFLYVDQIGNIDSVRLNKHTKLNVLFKKRNLPHICNQKKMDYYSIFPGLGHIYAGEYKEALASFLLNLSALSLGVWQAWEQFYITAYFGGASLLNKFHSGNRMRAEYLCSKKNYQETIKFQNKLIEILK